MTKGKLIVFALTALSLSSGAFTASAQKVFSDAFSYPDGALAGNGGWLQNSTVVLNPIQVTGGKVSLVSGGGQDVYQNFAATIPGTDGSFAYYGLTLNVSSASAAGDYFAHFTNGVTNPTNFSGRLAAITGATAGTYLLGYSESTVATTSYGATELTLGVDYRVVLRYGFVNGTLNDTGAIFVSPLVTPFNPTEASNTPYVLDTYNGATAELPQFTGFQFRQGTAGNAPNLLIDNLVVAAGDSSNFAIVANPANAVPEPGSAAALLGGAGLLIGYRRFGNRK